MISNVPRRFHRFLAMLLVATVFGTEAARAEVCTTTHFGPPSMMGVAADGILVPDDPFIGREVVEVRVTWDVVVDEGHNAAHIMADMNLPIHTRAGTGARIDFNGQTLGWSGSGTFHYRETTDRYNGFFAQAGARWGWTAVGLPTDAVEVLSTSRIEIDFQCTYRTDFNGDDKVGPADLDALTAEANLADGWAVPRADMLFDLNGDDRVDTADLDQWLADAATINGLGGPYSRGDANLDGDVDIWAEDGTGDAQTLIGNLGTTFGAVWSEGDFNGDGDVDLWAIDGTGDAQTLTSNLGGFSAGDQAVFAPAAMIVPEPTMGAMLGVLGTIIGIGITFHRRRACRWFIVTRT